MINFKFNFFLKELILFLPTVLLGVLMAYCFSFNPNLNQPVQPVDFSWVNLAVMIIFFAILSFLLTRHQRTSAIIMKTFLIILMLSGAQLFFSLFISPPFEFILAVMFLILVLVFKNVLMHNLGMILGLAGISAIVGMSLQPTTVVFILVLLSFYDIIAVYLTKHMVSMAKGMIASGAIFGFIIPIQWFGFFTRRDEARVGEDFMILGSGDIGLPTVLASSVAAMSLKGGLYVAVFSALGLFFTHLIFVNQQERKAMAALPPIATMSIIGYLVFILTI